MAFSDFINNIKYQGIEKINDNLSVAKRKGQGYVVLKDGKKLMDNIADISAFGDKFFVQTTDGIYYVFDTHTSNFGMVLEVSDLLLRTPDGTFGYYGKMIPEGLLLLERNSGLYYILYGSGHKKISEPYKKVEDPNSEGIRKVYPAMIGDKENLRNCHYYIDEVGNGDQICVISETQEDQNGNKIAEVFNRRSNTLQMCLFDENNQICSAMFNKITPYRDKYIATNKYQKRNRQGQIINEYDNCILDEDGEDVYVDFDKYFCMQNGDLLIRPCYEKNFELLNRNTCEPDIEEIEHPIVAENLNIFYGKINGRPTVFGLNMRISGVDQNVARAVISKLNGKRIAPSVIDRIIASETDIDSTFEAFNQVIQSNLNAQPQNSDLYEAYQKLIEARSALYKSSTRRIRKYTEQMSDLENKTRLTTLFGKKLEKSKFKKASGKKERADEDGDQPE